MDKTIEQAALEQIGTYDCKTCPPHYKVAAEFAQTENTRLCLLLADIRAALGDPEGKLMQEDFVEYCKEVVAERDRVREWVNGLSIAGWSATVDGNMDYLRLTPADRDMASWTVVNDEELPLVNKRVTPYEALTAYLKDKAALSGKE